MKCRLNYIWLLFHPESHPLLMWKRRKSQAQKEEQKVFLCSQRYSSTGRASALCGRRHLLYLFLVFWSSVPRTFLSYFQFLFQPMEREIIAAFDEGNPEEVISSAFKLKVTREDIHTLRNLQWLNDEIINFYMNLLMERNRQEGYPALYAFSTFFYPKLVAGGYKAVRRWTRGMDLFKQDLILVPIHLRVHWALVVIDVRRKSIRYFDSMGQKGDKICGTLFQYLQEESKEKRNLELSFSEWNLRSMESHEIPQQLNGSDCGVFMCKYADYISRDKPITFTQNNMPYFRRKMVWEIIHRQLL
uniref:SUMO specific peptidase 2 n=1 Tax=Nothoprocta perdicaria TaxID=30464 RepID=A0A8C6YRM0_NOTPE